MSNLIQLPSIVTNAVFVALAGSGIDVTPFMVQILLFVVCTFGLIIALTTLRRLRPAASILFAAVLLIIIYTWWDLLVHPLPTYVKAEPNPFPVGNIDVKIFDFRNYEIQATPPEIEPGQDVKVEYYPTFGDWPRRLELSAPHCTRVTKALNLVMLRDQRPIPISVECNG